MQSQHNPLVVVCAIWWFDLNRKVIFSVRIQRQLINYIPHQIVTCVNELFVYLQLILRLCKYLIPLLLAQTFP